MNTKRIFMVSGAAVLAFTATVSAGPMNVLPSSEIVAAPLMQTESVAYRRHPYRAQRGISPYAPLMGLTFLSLVGRYQRHYRHYGSRHHRYYYGYNNWNPGELSSYLMNSEDMNRRI
jgi:hypothetical protein